MRVEIRVLVAGKDADDLRPQRVLQRAGHRRKEILRAGQPHDRSQRKHGATRRYVLERPAHRIHAFAHRQQRAHISAVQHEQGHDRQGAGRLRGDAAAGSVSRRDLKA